MSFFSKMAYCRCNKPVFWGWAAAAAEVAAGIGLVLGLLTWLSALGLLAVLLVATRCTWRQKVYEQHPVDRADIVCAYLWRVEGLYIGLALMILLAGPGKYSIDYLLFSSL
jgi:putative oxidoreductase